MDHYNLNQQTVVLYLFKLIYKPVTNVVFILYPNDRVCVHY